MWDKFLPLALSLSGVVRRLSPGHTTKGCGGKVPRPIITAKSKATTWNCLVLVEASSSRSEPRFEAARACRLTTIKN
jgi:hypothetical protein